RRAEEHRRRADLAADERGAGDAEHPDPRHEPGGPEPPLLRHERQRALREPGRGEGLDARPDRRNGRGGEVDPMPILYLARHGETDWNVSGQIMGERPVPLNERGREQARRLAYDVEGLGVRLLLSSPVARARETAELLAERLRLPVEQDGGLTEIGVGEWEGLFWRDLADEIARRDL